jgi:hypothetical protein
MGVVARAAWSRVESGEVDWIVLGKSILRLLEEMHLLLYVADPTMREVLAEQG